ncbi:MAG: hypothetical protein K6G01_05010 [Eubacterium sp.]|nr:hypothetical protein [Eubacterium sp.]
MKKFIVSMALTGVLVGTLAGCSGGTSADVTSIEVSKNGEITNIIKEDFSEDYYSEEDLKSFIDEQIETYTQEHSDAEIDAKSISFDEESGVLTAKLTFGSYEDYAGFNSVTLYAASVIQAMADGYSFDEDFYDVTSVAEAETESESSGSGSLSTQEDTNYKTVDVDTIKSDSDLKVVVTNERLAVKVKGDILYVSDPTAQVLDDDMVELPDTQAYETGAETPVVYIVYK